MNTDVRRPRAPECSPPRQRLVPLREICNIAAHPTTPRVVPLSGGLRIVFPGRRPRHRQGV